MENNIIKFKNIVEEMKAVARGEKKSSSDIPKVTYENELAREFIISKEKK